MGLETVGHNPRGPEAGPGRSCQIADETNDQQGLGQRKG